MRINTCNYCLGVIKIFCADIGLSLKQVKKPQITLQLNLQLKVFKAGESLSLRIRVANSSVVSQSTVPEKMTTGTFTHNS